jgi:DNA-binding GntR family transcriptional regulator
MPKEIAALPIGRIEHETLSQRVYGDLRELIMSGRLQPGQRLTLKNLSEAVGTSQMPVREALRQLAAEGALELLPNKFVRVPLMTKDKFLELLAIRLQVECLALEHATQRITKPQLQELAHHHEAFLKEVSRKQPDPTIAIDANMRFHFTAYRAAQMPILMDLIEGLWLQVGPVLNLDMRSGSKRLTDAESARNHHQKILEAMTQKNIKAAKTALVADLTSAANFIVSLGKLK